MDFVPVLNAVQAELRMLLDNQRVENTLWFQYPGSVSTANMTALANALITWWSAQYAVGLTTQLRLVECKVSDMSAADASAVTVTAPANTIGTNTNPPAPNNVSFTITFRTSGRGRTARGRNYVTGFVNGHFTANTLASTTRNALVASYSSLIGLAADNGCTWVVASRRLNKNPRLIGVTRPIISAVAVDDTADSQRRRLPKRGQ
jgi:hypothetical protein